MKLPKETRKAVKNDGLSRVKVGTALVQIIEAKGGNRNEAAARVGDAPSQMSRLMHGHFDEFSVDRLTKMAAREGAVVKLTMSWKPKQRGRITTDVQVRTAEHIRPTGRKS